MTPIANGKIEARLAASNPKNVTEKMSVTAVTLLLEEGTRQALPHPEQAAGEAGALHHLLRNEIVRWWQEGHEYMTHPTLFNGRKSVPWAMKKQPLPRPS